ncbi:MAG: hypothetical protein JWQ78_1042 [Sediminibacterium sp.]|nr:hypothetical protein [Sediminibacterium sp.]
MISIYLAPMKTATIQELKQELNGLAPGKLLELCLRMARFKKENKELLTYLLFEAHNEEGYIGSVKLLIDEGFSEIPKSTLYLTKKSLRKILRAANKYIRYSGSKQVEVALLIYFCQKMKDSGIRIRQTTVLHNIYLQQIKKINTSLTLLHEDLQYDYQRELDALKLEEGESLVTKIFGRRKG